MSVPETPEERQKQILLQVLGFKDTSAFKDIQVTRFGHKIALDITTYIKDVENALETEKLRLHKFFITDFQLLKDGEHHFIFGVHEEYEKLLEHLHNFKDKVGHDIDVIKTAIFNELHKINIKIHHL